MSPRTSPIMQIIFSLWSVEISEGILRNQKIIIGLDSFSNHRLIYTLTHVESLIYESQEAGFQQDWHASEAEVRIQQMEAGNSTGWR